MGRIQIESIGLNGQTTIGVEAYSDDIAKQLRSADLSDVLAQLASDEPGARDQAILSLLGYAAFENEGARQAILDYLQGLSVPTTLAEAQHKTRILDQLKGQDWTRTKLPTILGRDLLLIENNNVTRQWITGILEFFEDLGPEDRGVLSDVLARRRFSSKLQARIEALIDGCTEGGWW